jgi:hypothetical protein
VCLFRKLGCLSYYVVLALLNLANQTVRGRIRGNKLHYIANSYGIGGFNSAYLELTLYTAFKFFAFAVLNRVVTACGSYNRAFIHKFSVFACKTEKNDSLFCSNEFKKQKNLSLFYFFQIKFQR